MGNFILDFQFWFKTCNSKEKYWLQPFAPAPVWIQSNSYRIKIPGSLSRDHWTFNCYARKNFKKFRVWVKVMCILYKIKYHKLSFLLRKLKFFKIWKFIIFSRPSWMWRTNRNCKFKEWFLSELSFLNFQQFHSKMFQSIFTVMNSEFFGPDFDQYVRF